MSLIHCSRKTMPGTFWAYATKEQACQNALSVGAKHMMYRRLTDNAFRVNR